MMKMILVTCTEGCRAELEALLERHGVNGYTEVPNVYGRGKTGKHLGTRAYPGSASLLMTVLPDEKMPEVVQALEYASRSCAAGQGLHVYALNVEEVI